VDFQKLWSHPIIESIRKSDSKQFEGLASMSKAMFGSGPEDLKSFVLFVPELKEVTNVIPFAVAVTFRDGYDRNKIESGASAMLDRRFKVKVVGVDRHCAVVLVNLPDRYATPRPIDDDGPLAAALRDASSGKHLVSGGSTLSNLPDLLRADELPDDLKPFRPLLRARTITVALDAGKTIDLAIDVKTGAASEAVACEKALGLLLAMLQNSFDMGIKQFAESRTMPRKDLADFLKAVLSSTRAAKFTTLGNETRLSCSLPTTLNFASAYLAAKEAAQQGAVRTQSANNLKQIAIAIHSYHDVYGNFPPAAVCDKTGKPMLSWRVLMLPYLDEGKLFKEFKLDEPWDSEHNKKLIHRMPMVYGVPGTTDHEKHQTHYRVFVRNGAAFDWLMGLKLTGITDGTSNTWLCVTAAEPVIWTKPDELEFDPDKDMSKLVGKVVGGVFQAAYCDGSVRAMQKIPSKDVVNALITCAGGEVIPELDE
jgi:hypothetical protein